jgi:type II secretory pathway pseudopilin PulG
MDASPVELAFGSTHALLTIARDIAKEIIKMDENTNYQEPTEGSPRWMGIAVVALAILSLVGVGLAWNAGGHARDAEQALATQTKTFQQSQDGINQRMAQAERTNAELQAEVNLVGDKLKLTEEQLSTARNQVKQSRADYTKKLNDVQSTLATKASADDVKALGTDVNGVKSDLDSTKGNIEQLRGEHGELIARNHEELEQLKRMGERDYYEFSLTAKGQKEHVGQTMIEFRSASGKKHQYTIAMYVDDTRLEKKNRSVNEPIYFYAGGSRQPMELVVNQVTDKKISGYLSAPKAIAASAKTN